MDDDDDNESIISVSRTNENNAVGSKVTNLKGTFIGGSSRRVRHRNRRYAYHISQIIAEQIDQI